MTTLDAPKAHPDIVESTPADLVGEAAPAAPEHPDITTEASATLGEQTAEPSAKTRNEIEDERYRNLSPEAKERMYRIQPATQRILGTHINHY